MQMTLDFAGGLTTRFRTLKQACAHAVYSHRYGLSGVAAACDQSPSELSKRLADSDSPENRPLRDKDIEAILDETHDFTPIYWLIEKYLQDPAVKREAALSQLAHLAPTFVALAEQAGIQLPKAKR